MDSRNKTYTLPVMYDDISVRDKKKVRAQYIDQQKNMCFFCKHPLNEKAPDFVTKKKVNWHLFPPFFLKYPIHLQHCHTTGLTEGAVHAHCNAVWWCYYGR